MVMPYNFNPYEHDGIGDVPIDELRCGNPLFVWIILPRQASDKPRNS
jgi:hypothetical protein